jgi:hypothetical protein
MNPFLNDCILAEKNINMLPNADKSTTFSKNITNTNINSTTKYPPSEKRLSLTKAYSCSDASSLSIPGNCVFITPKQFSELITHERKSLSIIDCRSQIDFGCERIRSSYNVNCRAKLMAKNYYQNV